MGDKPRLLDLFCGAGGCSAGYAQAGFEVVGVDQVAQPHYPFTFVQDDALTYALTYGRQFDAIHASPPCQIFTSLGRINKIGRGKHVDLVGKTRDVLCRLKCPWVIENVEGAPLVRPVLLCGSMFGLGANCRDGAWHQLRRHRWFESSSMLFGRQCCHRGQPVGNYGNGGSQLGKGEDRFLKSLVGTMAERREAMEIDWMDRYEISQAVPPIYTRFLGMQLWIYLGPRWADRATASAGSASG